MQNLLTDKNALTLKILKISKFFFCINDNVRLACQRWLFPVSLPAMLIFFADMRCWKRIVIYQNDIDIK